MSLLLLLLLPSFLQRLRLRQCCPRLLLHYPRQTSSGRCSPAVAAPSTCRCSSPRTGGARAGEIHKCTIGPSSGSNERSGCCPPDGVVLQARTILQCLLLVLVVGRVGQLSGPDEAPAPPGGRSRYSSRSRRHAAHALKAGSAATEGIPVEAKRVYLPAHGVRAG